LFFFAGWLDIVLHGLPARSSVRSNAVCDLRESVPERHAIAASAPTVGDLRTSRAPPVDKGLATLPNLAIDRPEHHRLR
jgi:hypothetical protein